MTITEIYINYTQYKLYIFYTSHYSILTLQFTEIGAVSCSHDIRQCPSLLTLHQQRNTTGGVRTEACVVQ